MTDITPPEVTDRDVYITRAFAAPRDVVWRFFTEPEHLASWFGPDAFTVPVDTVAVDLETWWPLEPVHGRRGRHALPGPRHNRRHHRAGVD